ncbi:hypothetical protein EAE96_008051 [Botrytis aclada]|nr:hypothetical protein EAE96_008051 [Botrytis aclada]
MAKIQRRSWRKELLVAVQFECCCSDFRNSHSPRNQRHVTRAYGCHFRRSRRRSSWRNRDER